MGVAGLPLRMKPLLALVVLCFWLAASPLVQAVEMPQERDTPASAGDAPVAPEAPGGPAERRSVSVLEVLLVATGMATGYVLPRRIQRWYRSRQDRDGGGRTDQD